MLILFQRRGSYPQLRQLALLYPASLFWVKKSNTKSVFLSLSKKKTDVNLTFLKEKKFGNFIYFSKDFFFHTFQYLRFVQYLPSDSLTPPQSPSHARSCYPSAAAAIVPLLSRPDADSATRLLRWPATATGAFATRCCLVGPPPRASGCMAPPWRAFCRC